MATPSALPREGITMVLIPSGNVDDLKGIAMMATPSGDVRHTHTLAVRRLLDYFLSEAKQ